MNNNFPTRIYFTGFMATGKSRLAELTAAALGWKYYDTDTAVIKYTDCSIAEIFEKDGENYFRKLELQVLEELSKKRQVVIALGGGTLNEPKAREIIQKSGMLIGLWAKPETVLERVNRKNTRPLLANLTPEKKLKKIKSMMEERREVYAHACFQVESREDIPHHVLIKKIIARIKLETLKPLTVNLQERSYPIYINEGSFDLIRAVADKTDCPEKFIIVTDTHLKEHQKSAIRSLSESLERCRIFYFRTGEYEKNLSSINRLISYMLKSKFSRKTTLIALGGGIVGDMAGFAAAIYQRGVPFIQVPTTLLSMVDSSVGGKTGVNHKMGKNLIGAFYQPKAVVIDSQILSTLPEEEFIAGLAEVIKYAVIWDKNFFEFLTLEHNAIMSKEPDVLRKMVKRCCEIKADIVSKDEREGGIRAILNYGHTFGHALETLANYQGLTHGVAVSLGMRVAMRVAVLTGRTTSGEENRQTKMLDQYGFPTKHSVDKEAAWNHMGLDKKADGKNRMYIIPKEIGKVSRVKNIDKALIDSAWDVLSETKTKSGSRK